jgi:hypothetical protein
VSLLHPPIILIPWLFIAARDTPATMFNALNRFMSRLDGDAPQHQHDRDSFGFQVLRNTNLDLPIEPWFDYIVGINGRPIVHTNAF